MDQLEEIKSKINIVDFIQTYLPLKKAGRNFKALCPFHKEKTPSFIVSPDKQIWHCFGCGEGGDIFSFLMKIEGLEFGEALRILAQKVGVKIKPQVVGINNKKEKLYQINKIAALIYQKFLLETSTGKPILDYLKKRKIKIETIKEFLIGFAPANNSLVKFLNKKGFKNQEIILSGLSLVRKGKIIDLFRNRIIFPLRNLYGDVVGFTGRTLLDNQMPKYLNTPQTLIFDKSRILYDLSLSKDEIRKKDLAILVEGQMDVLSAYQAGTKNVVCSSGTALTNSQIDLIKRFTENIALAFDQDEAGEKASHRSIDMLIEKNLNVSVINLPFGKDPDECIKKNPKAWHEAVKKTIPVMDFYFHNIFDKINKQPQNLSIKDKKKISLNLLPEIKKIPDKIEQAFYIQKLANLLLIEDKIIADALKNLPNKNDQRLEKTKMENFIQDNEDLFEEIILGLIIRFYKDIKSVLIKFDLEPDDFKNKDLKIIYKDLQTFLTLNESFDLKNFLKNLNKDKIEKINLCLLAVDHFYEDIEEKEIVDETEIIVKRLKKKSYYRYKKLIEKLIKEAEDKKDKDKIKKLMIKLKNILNKEKKLM